jgi:hypothetical protein
VFDPFSGFLISTPAEWVYLIKGCKKLDQCVAGGIGAMSHWAELAELLFVLSVRARSRIEARELPSRELDVNFWLSIGGWPKTGVVC